MDHTGLPLQTTLYLPLPCERSPDGATWTADIWFSSLLSYRHRKDERLSWPSWLTYSGRYTHISGHTSATDRAEARESSPVGDRRYNHWATQLLTAETRTPSQINITEQTAEFCLSTFTKTDQLHWLLELNKILSSSHLKAFIVKAFNKKWLPQQSYFFAGTVFCKFHSFSMWSSDAVISTGSTGWNTRARMPSKWLQ